VRTSATRLAGWPAVINGDVRTARVVLRAVAASTGERIARRLVARPCPHSLPLGRGTPEKPVRAAEYQEARAAWLEEVDR